jgi:hypothetical protein
VVRVKGDLMLQKFLVSGSVFVAVIGLSSLLFPPALYAQGSRQPPTTGQPTLRPQKTVSDKELQSFAKAYVAVQEIRASHETALGTVQDPAQTQKIQQDANIKMVKAVDQQGLTLEQYTEILTAVNGDEQLAKKAQELIAKERAS